MHISRHARAVLQLARCIDRRQPVRSAESCILSPMSVLADADPPRRAAEDVATLQRDGYSIEKVIFESRPGFQVTANLYLTDDEPPLPGVIVPCGHSDDGKAAAEVLLKTGELHDIDPRSLGRWLWVR